MGNSPSRPDEEVYKATAANSVAALTKVIQSVQARSGAAAVRDILGFKDKEGRTPLHLACARNYHHCARKLLESGADVHAINARVDSAGTALHEATRNRHEAMAELLLSYGASPFQSNAAGKTCLDEAVLQGAGNLLQRFKHMATWRGDVAIKLSRMGGLLQPFKSRHVLLLPYLSFPSPSHPAVCRCQLWVFKDANALVPKARLWMDGAVMLRGTGVDPATHASQVELVLRLHSTHKVPSGDLHTRYDRGYCVFLRARDSSVRALQDLDELHAFVASGAFNEPRPLVGGAAGAAGVAATAAAAATAAGAVPWTQMPANLPAFPSLTANSSFSSASAPSTAIAGAVSAASHSTPANSGGGGRAAPSHSASFGNAASDGGAGAAAARGNRRTLSDAGFQMPLPPTQAAGAESFVDGMRALPGESDADFASRLASAISAHQSAPPVAGHAANDQGSPLPPEGARGQPTTPSAPPLVASAPAAPEDDRLCVVCLSAPREVGFLHGASVHVSVCRDCCSEFRPGTSVCPLCRQTVERVLNVF